MARIHGKNGQVKMDPAGGSSLVAVADINGFTLDFSRDFVDVTCFGDTNKQKVPGLPNFSGTIKGVWNKDSTPALIDVALGTTAVTLRLTPNTDEPTYYFEGLAYLSLKVTNDSNGAVTFDGTFEAAGNWTQNP